MPASNEVLVTVVAAAVAGAGLVWKFVAGMLHRHEEAALAREEERKSEIERLRDKQDQSEATNLDLTGRVNKLEGEREGFIAGVETMGAQFVKQTADEVAKRINQDGA